MENAHAQLELLLETLHLPSDGVSFTTHGLDIAPVATDQELLSIGHRLFAVRLYTKWALGSLFAEMQRRQRARQDERQTRGGKSFGDPDIIPGGALEFASVHDIDPKEFREVTGVCTFYADCKDTPALSFDHHREAMWGVDDGQPKQLERALGFLRYAFEHKLSVTQLRRHIRASHASEPAEPEQLEIASYAVVFDFMRWCKRELQQVHTYSPDRARLILSDLGQATFDYIDALRELARESSGGEGKR